ncbi:hypothetical protein EMIT0P100_30266 [Pseudomonas sp. IT-P100]
MPGTRGLPSGSRPHTASPVRTHADHSANRRRESMATKICLLPLESSIEAEAWLAKSALTFLTLIHSIQACLSMWGANAHSIVFRGVRGTVVTRIFLSGAAIGCDRERC